MGDLLAFVFNIIASFVLLDSAVVLVMQTFIIIMYNSWANNECEANVKQQKIKRLNTDDGFNKEQSIWRRNSRLRWSITPLKFNLWNINNGL